MGFSSVRDIIDAHENGSVKYATFRKAPTQTTTVGIWFDLALSPGNPVPFYYASSPLEGVVMDSSNGGLPHGKSVSPYTKVLRKCLALGTVATPLPMPMMILDYLMYYPFIDESLAAEEQLMVNNFPLSRYEDGAGVQMMAVVVAGHAAGGATFTVKYTNQDGVTGRVSQSVTLNNQFVNGTILTSALATAGCSGPFIPLQDKDTGVRAIESVTMSGADVGLFTLVLVKPIAQFSLRGLGAPVEIDYLKDFSQLPVIKDDAYLNFICCPVGTLAGTSIHGELTVAWR